MDFATIFKALVSLLFVICLFYGLTIIMRKYLEKGILKSKSSINIKDIQVLDPIRKVVNIEYNNKSYLVLLGNNEILLDTYEK